jgi:hypothetical protein
VSSEPLEIWTELTQTGQWCDKCALPSAVGISMRTVSSEGVGPGGIVGTFCPDCSKKEDQ